MFIVINESDNREQNIEDYDYLKSGEFAPLIHEIYGFNVGTDMQSVEAFKTDLKNYIEAVGHQTFGKNDSDAMKAIKALFDEDAKILDKEKLEEILRDSGIVKGGDQKRAKELFNTLGVALSYNFMQGYVIDPYWISHAVYMVVDHMQKHKKKIIKETDLSEVFAMERSAYPANKFDTILSLMAHHRIGFNNDGGVRGLIVPCAASQNKPKDIVIGKIDPDCLITQVERDELQEFPADFFYRFICENQGEIEKNGEIWSMWQNGMVLSGDGASAFVELKENRRIEISIWSERKNEYSDKIEALIDKLLKEYQLESIKDNLKRGGKAIRFITAAKKAIGAVAVGVATKLAADAISGTPH